MKISTLQHRKQRNALAITLLIATIVDGKKISKEIGKPYTEESKNAKDLVWQRIHAAREVVKELSKDQRITKFRISNNLL